MNGTASSVDYHHAVRIGRIVVIGVRLLGPLLVAERFFDFFRGTNLTGIDPELLLWECAARLWLKEGALLLLLNAPRLPAEAAAHSTTIRAPDGHAARPAGESVPDSVIHIGSSVGVEDQQPVRVRRIVVLRVSLHCPLIVGEFFLDLLSSSQLRGIYPLLRSRDRRGDNKRRANQECDAYFGSTLMRLFVLKFHQEKPKRNYRRTAVSWARRPSRAAPDAVPLPVAAVRRRNRMGPRDAGRHWPCPLDR